MNAQWKLWAAKIDALSSRERVLVLLGVVALVLAIMNAVLLDPVTRRVKTMTAQLAADRVQIAAMRQQLQMTENEPVVDPDAVNRTRLAEVHAQLQDATTSLDVMQKELVSPDRMAGLLEDILKKNGQLKLLSLKTLADTNDAAPNPGAAATEKTAALAIYRHGVELKVQGRYLDLLNYLHTLEKLPWHMLWGNVTLAADVYPQSTLTVTIYTLSLDQAWLSI